MASAAEELCESEVLWPEAPHDDGDATPSSSWSVAPRSRTPAARGVPERLTIHPGSRPVDIPRPAASSAARRRDHEDEDGGWSGSGTMVPPHVLVSRRRLEGPAAAFALRSGPGRARELSHLRNSVLRMTGFIEG
ncbi:protein S40-1-like [Miscanthus floridulus]|uniref:protein S40-1-like n=1 Tax=Miscanthus floridulus TaxID=154761 RepID=UPI0034583334